MHQQDNRWTSNPETSRSNYNYSYNNEYHPGLMSGSQPSTPRPEILSSPTEKTNTTPDLIRKRPPLPSRPASFTTTTFHSNPYPNNVSLRRRRTETSMLSFEAGPTFTQTKQLLDLYNMDQTNGYQVQLHAKMDRGFFRAEQDWTCYRRNYFQVSSTFDIHGINYLIQGPEIPCLVRTNDQEVFQIDYFTIGVTARVSGSDKKIELVQHTPKRDKGPQMIPEPRVISPGGNLHMASVGSNHNIVTFERMQFKTATANNGKRRAAQQYYEIVVDLIGNSSSTGKTFNVATTVSTPLVVRGRSPGHYADSHTRYKSMDAGQPTSVPFNQLEQQQPFRYPPPPPTANASDYNNNSYYSPYNFPMRNEQEQPRDHNAYLMHPYSQQQTNDPYYDKPSYWPSHHRGSTSTELNNNHHHAYHMRPMSKDNASTSSIDNNESRHYLQQPPH